MCDIIVKDGELEYLRSGNIAVPHCFTTRRGGVSTGIFDSLNLSFSRGDDPAHVLENYRRIGLSLGFTPEDVVNARQIHSDIVVKVGPEHRGKLMEPGASPECDALITNTPGLALYVSTADCTPILLWDPVTGAVGAAHAGWRGTAMKIAVKTLQAMVENFGCDPKNVRAAIGPNIAACHFETDADVPEAILAAYGEKAREFIEKKGEKYFLDLKAINALGLREAGVEDIDLSGSCTACAPHRFWSHRVTSGRRGSQGAVILCKEVIR